ncbi:MAG: hypothetical protein M3299_13675 [Thermoproteota archaeon]|nr:hypothetical protein [Thermoproteota archaeon]
MTMRKSTKTITMMTINILAIIAAATPLTGVEAQMGGAAAAPAVTTTTTTTTTTIVNNTTDTTSSGIELSQQPVLQERTRAVSETQINYAHVSITYTGNGTLALPNNNIANFTSNGSALVSFLTQSAQGTETIRTGNGETATITFYEIVKFNPATREAKGIIIAEIQTNPTGMLASLNGMILAGIDDIQLNGESNVTLWEWESGISDLDIFPVQDELRLQ